MLEKHDDNPEKIRQLAQGRSLLHETPRCYGELIPIELAETTKRVLHEMFALVALTIGALFTPSFVSIAVIVTAASTPYPVLTA